MTTTVANQAHNYTSNAATLAQPQASHAALATAATRRTASGRDTAGKQQKSFAAALLKALSTFVV